MDGECRTRYSHPPDSVIFHFSHVVRSLADKWGVLAPPAIPPLSFYFFLGEILCLIGV